MEVMMQSFLCPYEIQAFNEREVVYDINRKAFTRGVDFMDDAYKALWFGMVKTLVSTEWALWEETEGVPEDVMRIKIAKKIDKFSR